MSSHSPVPVIIWPIAASKENACAMRAIKNAANINRLPVLSLGPPITNLVEADIEVLRLTSILHDPTKFFLFAAFNSADNPVEYAWWNVTPGRSVQQWDAVESERFPDKASEPVNANHAADRERFRKRRLLMGSRDFLCLNELFVNGRYQRRGLGTQLVLWGLRKADSMGLEVYTESSLEGVGLYAALGFREVGRVLVQAETGVQPLSYALMLREPS